MRFLPLLFTVFIDSLCFGLVFPIFSALIMNPEQSILPPDTTLSMRGWIYGLLVSAFCVGQFFGGPVLGALSDRLGRKKVLLLTLWISFGTCLLAGMGIVLESIILILIARLLNGGAAANWSIAQSIIVDCSTEEEKAKNFGLLGMAWGTGFVIGPFAGGILTNPNFFFGGSLTVPFWFAAGLCLFNTLLLMRRLEESLPANRMAKVNLMAAIHHLKKAFTTPKLRSIFLVMFIFCLGWGFFTEFSPVFLIRHLGYDLGQVANFYAWIGLWIAICQGILIRPFLKHFSPNVLLPCALLGLGLVLPLMLFVHETWTLYALMPFLAFFESLISPTSTTLVSNLSDKEAQGEVLGIHNSLQWAAIGFASLFSGSAVALIHHLPITVGCAAMLVAMFVFLKAFKKGTRSAVN